MKKYLFYTTLAIFILSSFIGIKTIKAQTGIVVVSPNGGETLQIGKSHTIVWSNPGGNTGTINISLRTQKEGVIPVTVIPIISGLTNTYPQGMYSWTPISNITPGNYIIRIYDEANPSTYDDSDNFFSITSSKITIALPNGGETLQIGKAYTISWDAAWGESFSQTQQFSISLRKCKENTTECFIKSIAGPIYPTLFLNFNASYSWTPDSSIVPGQYIIRVNVSGESIYDDSDNFFTITAPKITIASPNGGETLQRVNSYTIRWDSVGISGKVTITARDKKEDIPPYTVIPISQTDNTGSYTWTIGNDAILGDYYLKICNSDGTVCDYSDSRFTIASAAAISIKVASPNGGETWEILGSYKITWSNDFATALSGKQISISLRSGIGDYTGYFVKSIAGPINNTGSYIWTIDNSITPGKYIIRVNIAGESVYDDSDNFFSIISQSQPKVTLTSPNGGEQWEKGKTYNITWTIANDNLIGNSISLHLSKLNDSSFSYTLNLPTLLKSTGVSTYSFAWKIPDFLDTRNDYKVAVVLAGSGSVQSFSDSSDASFSIVATATSSVSVISPNGGETIQVGKPYTITWNTSGIDGNAATISLRGGFGSLSSHLKDIAAYINNTGSYSWTPDTNISPASNYLIRVTAFSVSGQATYDDSDNFFSIIAPQLERATDSDNSPDYVKNPISYSITPEKYPDLFVAGVGKGTYIGKSSNAPYYIFGQHPDPLVPKSTTDNYDTYFDHCANNTQLNEAYITSDGKLGGHGVIAPQGYICSNGAFVRSSSSIRVLYPKGGEIWIRKNATYTVQWESSNVSKVIIRLSSVNDDIYNVYLSTNPGTYNFTVPSNFKGGAAKLYVINQDNENVFGMPPNGYIDIVSESQPVLSITPTNIVQGQRYSFAAQVMNAPPLSAVNFYLQRPDGTMKYDSYTIPGKETGPFGSSTLTTEQTITGGQTGVYKAWVTVKDYKSNIIEFNVSSLEQPSITVLSPNGGEKLEIGKESSIRWSTKGKINSIDINLIKGGSEVYKLFSSVMNLGGSTRIGWTPGQFKSGDDYKIRISDAANNNIYDESDNFFSIGKTSQIECLPDGTLIKVPDDPKVYTIINCQKKWIQSMEEFEQSNYKLSEVKEFSPSIVEVYTDYLRAKEKLLKALNNDKVYRIINEKRLWIPSIPVFDALGFKKDDISAVAQSELEKYPRVKLVQVSGDSKVYYLTESGLKKYIPSSSVFESYDNKWQDIIKITPTELNNFPDVILIKSQGDYKVYKLESGQKRWIKTASIFEKNNYNWTDILSVNNTELNAYSGGQDIE